ncbi:MAG: CDP-alcohol phosphatidyltransferase family protein, partial [Desulfuromonadales bacterium]
MSQNGRRGQMTLPNALTLLRILMVPALLIAVIYNRTAIALVLFLIAAATDLLDGFLARRLGQKTVLGTYLDPLADKLLMAVCFISLAVVRLLPAWLAVLAVSKDLFVSLGL